MAGEKKKWYEHEVVRWLISLGVSLIVMGYALEVKVGKLEETDHAEKTYVRKDIDDVRHNDLDRRLSGIESTLKEINNKIPKQPKGTNP